MARKKAARSGPAPPFVLQLAEAEGRSESGIHIRTLVARESTEVSKSEAVRLNRGQRTAEQTHADEEEMYLIISGKGEVVLDGVPHAVSAHACAWVPRGCTHYVQAAPDSALQYVYFAVYPDETGRKE
jgi:quercetin dioxygenase-like cupin family protein